VFWKLDLVGGGNRVWGSCGKGLEGSGVVGDLLSKQW
jgi:hypothetical protein